MSSHGRVALGGSRLRLVSVAWVAVFGLLAGCSTLDPPTIEPLIDSLAVEPDSVMLSFGAETTFTATGLFTDGIRRPVAVRWYIIGDPVGTLSVLEGSTVRFSARSPGSALLIGVGADLADTAEVTVRPPNPYPVFDGDVHDYLGVFQGPLSVARVFVLADPSGVRADFVIQLDFTVGPQGYAGVFIERGSLDGHQVTDLREFAGGHLNLAVRSTYDIQIGIRSDNITPGLEQSKVWLREEGLAQCEGEWESVSIPLARLAQLEPRLDFTRMEVFLVAAVDRPHLFAATSGSFWIAEVQWTRE
jgi:hypothetical protein